MRNRLNDEDNHDYSPNELAHLSIDNPRKYREIVESNLEEGDTIEDRQRRNLKAMQKFMKDNYD